MDTWLDNLGLKETNPGVFDGSWRGGPTTISISPIDGQVIGHVREATAADCSHAIRHAREAFLKWRAAPAPVRGETIRRLGDALRAAKSDLGRFVTLAT